MSLRFKRKKIASKIRYSPNPRHRFPLHQRSAQDPRFFLWLSKKSGGWKWPDFLQQRLSRSIYEFLARIGQQRPIRTEYALGKAGGRKAAKYSLSRRTA
mgnify:FL=1